jgi:hypothetical protein
MNAPSPARQGIPFRPDRDALAADHRRSFVRACVALMLGARQGTAPERIIRSWDDPRAELILRAATSATTTSSASALQLQTTAILPLLAPASASARLLAMARPLDLAGLASIRLPFIGQSGRPPVPFVAEGSPGEVVNLILSAVVLGPTKKLRILSALTREMAQASAANAETIIGDALAASAAQSLDSVLFSNAAAAASAPAGILFGVTPIPSAGTTGAAGVADDLAQLAGAIGSAGINPDDMVIVTTPALAMKIRVLASPKFTNVVLSSSSLAAGTVIALVKEGLATGYDGSVEIAASNETLVHTEDTAPLDLVSAGGVVAAPQRSAWQTDTTILRITGDAAWTVHPGSVSAVTGASW